MLYLFTVRFYGVVERKKILFKSIVNTQICSVGKKNMSTDEAAKWASGAENK